MAHLPMIRTSENLSVIIDNLPRIVGKNRQFKKSLFSQNLSIKVVKKTKLSVRKHIIGITSLIAWNLAVICLGGGACGGGGLTDILIMFVITRVWEGGMILIQMNGNSNLSIILKFSPMDGATGRRP